MKQYILVNIVSGESVHPDQNELGALSGLFRSPVGVALANNALRSAGSQWRWRERSGDCIGPVPARA